MPSPEKRRFAKPVSWLFSSKLVSGLKWILLYAISGKKADPRNWMHAKGDVCDEEDPEGDFWFDYMADTGDGQRGTYSLACMALSPLYLDETKGRVKLPEQIPPADERVYTRLPRGQFLFIGGDTAYHIANYSTLARRLQLSFDWAALDILAKKKRKIDVRPLFGIPGNHDYYDFLDGFNRQFRRPYDDDGTRLALLEGEDLSAGSRAEGPLLQLPGFRRVQEASYVALRLPNGWRFVGLDAQGGEIDRRQRHFFREVIEEDRKNGVDKLVLATPEPSTVFGKRASETSALSKTLEELDVEQPFLTNTGALVKGACRLDLSGDVHHYARHWGDEGTSYASVVSGGGGAFLHPTHTDFGNFDGSHGRPARRVYPIETDSQRETIARLLNPWVIFRGGNVGLAGALLAVLLTTAVTVRPTTRDVAARLLGSVARVGLWLRALPQSSLPALSPSIQGRPPLCDGRLLSALLPVLLLLFGMWLSKRHVDLLKSNLRKGVPNLPRGRNLRPQATAAIGFLLLSLFFVAAVGLQTGEQALHPFSASILVAIGAILGLGAALWNSLYREALFQQSRWDHIEWYNHVPRICLVAAGLAIPFATFMTFGTASLTAVTFDVLVFLLVAGLLLGLPALAALRGAVFHEWRGKVFFGAIGLWHALMQLSIPVLVISYLDYADIAGLAILIGIVNLAIVIIARRQWGLVRPLGQTWWIGVLTLSAWILVGAASLWTVAHFGQPQTIDWWRLLCSTVVGAAMSCVHFGWYLATALGFNGHNNEAGGAARLQRYRHLLRIRLAKDGATVYAIGIDQPKEDLEALELRLVDKFELAAKPTAQAAP